MATKKKVKDIKQELLAGTWRSWYLQFQPKHEGDILIGFFSDGGIGSHPAIIEASMLSAIDNSEDEFNLFIATGSTNVMPEALLAVYSPDVPKSDGWYRDGWYIKGISNSLAQEIIESGGSDVYENYGDNHGNDTVFEKAFGLAEYPYDNSNVQILTVIPNVKLNQVYWSDAPEHSHSYWEPPYKAIPIKSLI